MSDDVDIDCSSVLDNISFDEMGARIFAAILEAASGQKTASERLDMGESEWVPWVPEAMF